MNSITKEFKAAAEKCHEEERVRYVKSTQFAGKDYIERLKTIAKDKVLDEWKKAGRQNLDDIYYNVELDVNMMTY